MNWDNPEDRLKIIKKYWVSAYEETNKLTSLADCLDAYEYWIPWMIEEIESLRLQLVVTKKRMEAAQDAYAALLESKSINNK